MGLPASLRAGPIGSDVIGSDVVIGDSRWAGAWGLRADFIAKTTCSVLFVSVGDVMVILSLPVSLTRLDPLLTDQTC